MQPWNRQEDLYVLIWGDLKHMLLHEKKQSAEQYILNAALGVRR